jgi:DNA-binding NarL/FixJ family response regulator
VLQAVRARLASAAIEIAGVSSTVDDALDADVDVIMAVDDTPSGTVLDEGGPGLIMLGDDQSVRRLAGRAGPAWGVLPPDASGPELAAAAAAVAQGLVVVPPSSARGLARTVEDEDDVEREALTTREREVLELASHGLSNRDLAATLGISEHTVKFHLASIYGKLGAGSRTEAVRRGLRRGLITL